MKYNIVYLHTHDSGRMIGAYDPGMQTPHLVDLAKEGVTFRRAYCANPTCSPSRASLLSGSYPHENGMWGLAHRGFKMNDYNHHMGAYFRTLGYETRLFGMQHEAADEKDLPYTETYVASRETNPTNQDWEEDNVAHAIDFIKNHSDKPYFISVGLSYTHKPYPKPDPEEDPRYVKVPEGLPDTPEIREEFAGYMTTVRRADALFGKVIDAIKASGQFDNTIVFYTTDHGVALPGMKCTLTDKGIGISLIMSIPGYRDGEVKDTMVSHVDVFPTLCDLLGVEHPDWLSGVSMKPVLDGAESVRDSVFAEINYHAARNPQRAVRTDRYKYIRRYDGVLQNVPANIDDGAAKTFLCEHGLLDEMHDEEELFDLYLDPAERINRAGDPAYAQALADMRALLADYQAKTNDTIAETGLLPIPGMIVNKLECVNPDSKDPADYE